MVNVVVSIIVVNWNGKHLLMECLSSLERQTYREFEILLVDNNSADESVEFVQNEFPCVKVVPLAENCGFAGGNIAGYEYASGELIALVNTDVVLEPSWLSNMVTAIQRDASIGICASKIIKTSSGMLDSAGDYFTFAFCVARPGENRDPEEYHEDHFVPGACAAAALYRREMLNQIGFLDADFFLNHEDTDLNLRAMVSGWRCLFVSNAVAYHKVSASIGVFSDVSVYYFARNGLWVWLKNVPTPLLFRYWCQRVAYELSSALALCVLHRKWRPYIRGKLDSLKGIRCVIGKRKRIQQLVRLSGPQIEAHLIPLHTYLWDRVKELRSS